MNTKDLIQLNNEKREQLTEKNSEYYGDMLVYIRTNFNKSERYTEEVLLELLEHLLQAQEEGRTAKEVFGEDPKAYCNDIIGEFLLRKNQSTYICFLYCYESYRRRRHNCRSRRVCLTLFLRSRKRQYFNPARVRNTDNSN